MVLPLVFIAATFLVALAQTTPPAPPLRASSVEACQPCHSEIIRSFKDTAHHNASRPASAGAILGTFDTGRNLLRTRTDGVYFKMEQGPEGFYQTGYEKGRTRTERFDLVIGSGRRGQSYLYWKNQLLFQLPVSYLAATGDWVNSPGYVDGTVHFDRLIPPRCLECHTTNFPFLGSFPDGRYASDYVLGIACQRCHGADTEHARLRNPARFSRQRKLDLCGQCHSGIRELRKLPFSYRPGEPLDEYLAPEPSPVKTRPDVHGNQVGLLAQSKCFQASRDLTCSNCHDVHAGERDLSALSRKCLTCHRAEACKLAPRLGSRISENCIDCHMPAEPSAVIRLQSPGKSFAQSYRNHTIALYRDASRQFIESLQRKGNE